MSDAALIQELKANGLRCGKFRKDQLENAVFLPVKRNPWLRHFVPGFTALSLFIRKANAQEFSTSPVHQTISVTGDSSNQKTNAVLADSWIEGIVTDQFKKPLDSVVVVLPDTDFRTMTDSLGQYKIAVPSSLKSVLAEYKYQL